MKMRCFPPLAVIVAACLWPSGAMAQAGMMPVAGPESRAAVAAGMDTRGTGELPGTGEDPGAWERSGSVPLAVGAELDSPAALRRQALAAMETLREEIATLAALKNAQAALLAWNRGLVEADVGPATLASALCNDPALSLWCRQLPATFGAPNTPSAGDAPTGGYTEDGHDRD